MKRQTLHFTILASIITAAFSKELETELSFKAKLIKNIDYLLGVDRNSMNGLPAHCKQGKSELNTCTECEEGYYLVKSGETTMICASCPEALSGCRICSSSSFTEKKDIQCTNCVFPKMPNSNLNECVGRTVLLYYFVAYCIVAVVLGVLSCMEIGRMKGGKRTGDEDGETGDMIRKGLLSGSENLSNSEDVEDDDDVLDD